MPQVKTVKSLLAVFLVLTASFTGCSDPNAQSPLNPDTGSHSDNWLPKAHMAAATSDPGSCSACHGADFRGGISGVSCTSCHLGSPSSVHPSDWVPVYSAHGSYVKTNSTSACANMYCHGLSLTGVPDSGPSCTSCHLGGITSEHPADWVPMYSTHGPYASANGTNSCSNQSCHGTTLTGAPDSGPSCTSCHMGGVTNIHPAGWLGDACSNHGNYALTNGTTGCANAYCHGTNLGGVPQSGPSCTKCHPTIPTSSSCGTCHGRPPAGTTYPDIAGKHATHMALNGVTCATCHNRSCDQHMNGTVDVIFDTAYNAETGTASFGTVAGATCGNVSCHGGPRSQRIRTTVVSGVYFYTQVTSETTWTSDPSQTPDWYTGSISLSDTNQCFSCHDYGNTLYNGYFSGKHYRHAIELGVTCISCHDTLKLTNASFHFPDLRTHVISSSTASASTNSWLNYNGTTCTNATIGCHPDTRSWWQ